MRILGLNHDMYISSAAMLDDGRVTAAAAEERFNRQKRYRGFPREAVNYCLSKLPNDDSRVAHVAASWNPGAYLGHFNPLFSNHRRHFSEHLYAVPDHLADVIGAATRAPRQSTRLTLPIEGIETDLHFVNHHLAHAASAFYGSSFERAAYMTADSQGELETTTWGYGEGTRLTQLGRIEYPQSLGAFYSAITEFLGFKPNSDEWKVMALAALPPGESLDPMKNPFLGEVVHTLSDGTFELDLRYFNGFNHASPGLMTPRIEALLGPRRQPEDSLDERHLVIARYLQQTTETVVLNLLNMLHSKVGSDNLVLGGGVFMNSVMNGRLLDRTPFRSLSITPAPDDSGNAIGASYYVHHDVLGGNRAEPLTHGYTGPEFDDRQVGETLERFGLESVLIANPPAAAGAAIADGMLVGWFQGRMEFGQRALGNRSILADPRRADIKDRVNSAVKYREAFRPFAPAVLEAETENWFVTIGGQRAPFMERVLEICPDKRSQIPAVTHSDGSGRLQTVDAKTNPLFHALISEFNLRTGVPLVLNTSFNVNGEPIVCTPADAIRTFFTCGLETLFIGQFALSKSRAGMDRLTRLAELR